jgi:hypothetical protein
MHDLSHEAAHRLVPERRGAVTFLRRGLALLITSISIFGFGAAVAAAAEPTHFMFSETGTQLVAAGELCDFDYASTFRVDVNVIAFGDPDDLTKEIIHVALFKSHTNLDTGYTLSEVDHFTTEINAVRERIKQVGIFWHLRDPSGKLVVVQAGAFFFDTSTGEIRVTPNFNPDFASVICPALGGSPAI